LTMDGQILWKRFQKSVYPGDKFYRLPVYVQLFVVKAHIHEEQPKGQWESTQD